MNVLQKYEIKTMFRKASFMRKPKNWSTYFLLFIVMYVYIFYWLSCFYTQYPPSVPLYEPFSTGSGLILGAGASRASPGISIERTAIVVVRAFISGATLSVLLYHWDFILGNRTWDMLPVKYIDVGGDSNPGRLVSSLSTMPLHSLLLQRVIYVIKN